jgi:hypothetical protein
VSTSLCALLKERETQHPECQLFYRWCIEGCVISENHQLILMAFLVAVKLPGIFITLRKKQSINGFLKT